MNNMQASNSKARSLAFIVLAYGLAILSAWGYLFLPVFQSLSTGNLILNTFIADVIATVVIFVFSRLFRNSSFYDAYWSVIPPVIFHYWHFESGRGWDDPIVWMLGFVIWYWALRLTWNWSKHWSGLHHEDWRYVMLKENNKLEFLIDFFAIHFFPTVQVFLGILPVYAALFLLQGEPSILVYLAFLIGLSSASIQIIADSQLHAFLEIRKEGEIIQHGLWAWSRHPNYFGELLFWLSLALFGLSAYPQGWWWVSIGFVAMFLMFKFASIPMMEKRSLERRPDYQRIIDSISMLIPFPPKKV